MGVMGLGENGLKVSRYLGCLDVAIFPATSNTIREEGIENMCTIDSLSQKNFIVAYPKP
jgi:hypothetical protein